MTNLNRKVSPVLQNILRPFSYLFWLSVTNKANATRTNKDSVKQKAVQI